LVGEPRFGGALSSQTIRPRAGIDALNLRADADEQAVVEALFLGLMAPGESEAQAAATLAEELAAGMDEATLELCRAAALERFEAEAER
jgi:hypothetical protein